MDYAIKLNSIVDSIWPDQKSNDSLSPLKGDMSILEDFISTFSLNEFHQIIELCNQKALFLVLQKSDIIIKRYNQHLEDLLKQMDDFLRLWIDPTFPFNLKRSFDTDVLQFHIESSISKFMGKIIKEISKSITQSDWDVISNFLINLRQKSQYYQILIIKGYFDEIQNMETQFEQFQSMREIFKNFQYEVVGKVIPIIINNVSCCKETLQMLEIQFLQTNLSLMNESTNMKFNYINQSLDKYSISKIKYLKYNFEVLRKIINFDYDIHFSDEQDEKDFIVPFSFKKCVSFPVYIIKPFLQATFLVELYEIAKVLLCFNHEGNHVRVTFTDIIIDLINKIIKTRIADFEVSLKQKFIRQVLSGQTMLMSACIESEKTQTNILLKIIKGNIKLLKSTDIMDLVVFKLSEEWLMQIFKLVLMILNLQPSLNLDNYLPYKALCLTKQIVLQAIIYQMNTSHETLMRQIVCFGLSVQQTFLHKFIEGAKLSTKNQIGHYYSLEDLRLKRNRYFQNIKILCQIYLSPLNNSLKLIIQSINCVPKAINFLLFASYLLGNDFFHSASFYYVCQAQDITNFKKLSIGNSLILVNELMKHIDGSDFYKHKFQDILFLFIEKILQQFFQNHTVIAISLSENEVFLPIQQNLDMYMSNNSRLLTMLFGWMLKIINHKAKKNKSVEQQIESYFQIFIKYLKLLAYQNEQLDSFQIVSIQCELTHEFISFKDKFRMLGIHEGSRFLSELTILLHKQPQNQSIQQENDHRMYVLYQSQIKQLLKILQTNPNDWISICYEIGGLLQSIDKQKIYCSVIRLIGKQFIEKIALSCLHQPNHDKIKLVAYFTQSFLTFTQNQKIKNLHSWFPFVKNIFYTWNLYFKLVCFGNQSQEGWEQYCYEPLINLLANDNLNFYLLKRSIDIKEILTTFTTDLINFLNKELDNMYKSLKPQRTSLFKLLRIIFKSFTEFYILNGKEEDSNGFFLLIHRLIRLIKSRLKMINNRKFFTVSLLIDQLKPLNTILQNLKYTPIKYRYKPTFIDKICSFLKQQKVNLRSLETELYKFRVNYQKHVKFDQEKYRESEINLLINLSNTIEQLYDKQKSQKNNNQNTMSVSDEENVIQKEKLQEQMRQVEVQNQISSMNLLEKQMIWFDIEGNKSIIDY